MKRKHLLTLFALLLGFVLCFAGCTGKNDDTPATEPEPTGENTSGYQPGDDPIDTSVSDREAILAFLNGNGEEEGGDTEPTLPENPLDILNLLTLQIKDFKTEGLKFDSLSIQGGKGHLSANGSNVYFQIGTNGDILLMSQTGVDTYDTQIITLDDFPLSIPEIPELSAGDSHLTLPELTVDDLQPEGNGLYSISKDWFAGIVDAVMDEALKDSGMKAVEISAIKAVVKDYVDRLNIRVAFEVKENTVSATEIGLAADNDLIAELLEMLGTTFPCGASQTFSLNLNMRMELAEDAATPLTLALDFLIPVNTVDSNLEETEQTPDFYTFEATYLKADFDLKVSTPDAVGAKLLECTLDMEQISEFYPYAIENGVPVRKGAEAFASMINPDYLTLEMVDQMLAGSKTETTVSLTVTVAATGALNVAVEFTNDGNKTTLTFQIGMEPVAVTFPAAVEAYAKTFNEKFEPNKAVIEAEMAEILADEARIQQAYMAGISTEAYHFTAGGVYAIVSYWATSDDADAEIFAQFDGYTLVRPYDMTITTIE